jgi:hypothetical protein
MKKLLTLILQLPVLLCGLLVSCNQSDSGKIEYFPFKENESDMWGLISAKGEVLVSDKFKELPTLVKDDRFWVQDEDGFYQLYSTKSNTELVNENEYAYISDFSEGRAVVAQRDSNITIIKKDGSVVKRLDKVEGKNVKWVRAMSEGCAVYCADDSLQGMLNKDGEPILKAKKASVSDMKEHRFIVYDEFDFGFGEEADSVKLNDEMRELRKKFKVVIYNESGKKLLSFTRNKYSEISYEFQSNLLAVATDNNGETSWGLINDKGEEVVKPNSKYDEITEVRGENFIFRHDDKYGVASIDGKTVVNAQYTALQFADDKILIASTSELYGSNPAEFFYLNLNGEKPSTTKYEIITPFYLFKGNCAPVMKQKGMWQILNDKCEKIEKIPDIYDIEASNNMYVYSDYLDIPAFVKALNIRTDGVGDVYLNSSVETVLNIQAKQWGNESKLNPSSYSYTSEVYLYPEANNVNYSLVVKFPKNLSHQTYKSQKVIDYINYYYGYYYYHINKVPTGYKFNVMTPSKLCVKFEQYVSPMRGKLRKLYGGLVPQVKSLGEVEKENNSAMLVNIGGKNKVLLAMQDDKVILQMGNLTSAEQEIYEYSNSKEKFSTDNESNYPGKGLMEYKFGIHSYGEGD